MLNRINSLRVDETDMPRRLSELAKIDTSGALFSCVCKWRTIRAPALNEKLSERKIKMPGTHH